MVKLYLTDISALPDPLDRPVLLEQIAEVRKKRILSMKHQHSRRQSLGAGLLLEQVLQTYGLDDNEVSYGEHGKPEIEGIYFNLSHSEDMVICAVSDKPVGCDVEKICQAPEGIAKRYFSLREQKYLEQFSGEESDREFFRLWTIKESYVKMTGEGMCLPKDTYEVSLGENVEIYREGTKEDCYVSEMPVNGYMISVCAKDDENVIEVIKLLELNE